MERQLRRRRRPALSCLECRRRKIKCDRSEPCAHCVSAKIQCIFRVYRDEAVIRLQPQQGTSWDSTSSQSTHTPSSLAQVQQSSTAKLDIEDGSSSSECRAVAAVAEEVGPTSNLGRGDNIPRPHATNAEPDLQDLLRRVQKLEKLPVTSPIHGLSETGRDILERQSGLEGSQIQLNKTRVLRWSHWIGMAQEFSTIGACYAEAVGFGDGAPEFQEPEVKGYVLEIGEFLQKCKDISRSMKVGRPSRTLSTLKFDLSPPSREEADAMAAMYFQSFESTHRILHVPTFWLEYQRYWSHPESAPTDLRLKILLVLAIGSSLQDHDASFCNRTHQWIYAAQTWLSGPMEKDRLTITAMQIYCLTILARQICAIGGDLVWMSVGSLVHRAMQIGLHRDPRHLPVMSVLQAEVRRRLWASIVEIAVQSSLDSAMPPRISFDEFDSEAPSNINDNEIDETTTSLRPQPKTTFTSASMQLLLLDSLPIRLRILQLLTCLHSNLSYMDVLPLSAELTDAYRACSSFMSENPSPTVTPFHRNLLHYLIRRFLIPLHCPFAIQARTNPLFYYSLKISLDVAMALIAPEPDAEFSRLMAVAGGLFREGLRYAMTVISLELIGQTESQKVDGTLSRNSQYRVQLKGYIRDTIDLSVERIKRGENNVKGAAYLTMVLALVEAIEEGSSRELKIAKYGRDSFEVCYELLKERAADGSLGGSQDGGYTPAFDGGEELEGFGLDFDLGFFLPDVDFS